MMKRVQISSPNSYRDKMLASFIIGIGFWLINITHVSQNNLWFHVSRLISGGAFIFLLSYSFKAIKQEDKIGWAYFVTVVSMIISYVLLVLPTWI